MGSHTQYGGYIVDLNLVRTFVVPDLTDFKVCRYPFPLLRTERLNTIIAKKKLESYIYVEMINAMDIILTFLPPPFLQLTPFVTRNARATSGAGMYREFEHGPKDARFYLEEWKNNNGKY